MVTTFNEMIFRFALRIFALLRYLMSSGVERGGISPLDGLMDHPCEKMKSKEK